MASKQSSARAGDTDKISISLSRSDVMFLRRRARRLYRGNLSAVVGEGVRRIREEEGRDALVEWLGDAGAASAEERDVVRSEWETRDRAARSQKRRKP